MSIVETAGMSISVDERSWGEVLVIEGELDAANCGALSAALDLACAGWPPRVLVDVSRLGFMSSCGVRALAAAADRLRASGDLWVRGATAPVRRAFELAGKGSLLTGEPSPLGLE